MNSSPKGPLQELGWNGLRFQAPAGWQLDRVGRQYLLLASETGPALEATFSQVRGRFSHKRALKKLTAAAAGARLRAEPLPKAWQAALGAYETTGFAWSGNQGAGQGAVLFCPVCRKATVIQFYQAGAGPDFEQAARVLASFEDHPRAGEVLWAVFDFRAEVPERFRLTSHRIAAGYLELAFSAPGQALRLYRWGPATALLAGRDLAAFARERLRLPSSGPFYPGRAGTDTAIESQVLRSGPFFSGRAGTDEAAQSQPSRSGPFYPGRAGTDTAAQSQPSRSGPFFSGRAGTDAAAQSQLSRSGPAGKKRVGEEEALEWLSPPGRIWRRLLRPGRRHDRLRVWRLEEKNRILAVRLSGRRAVEAGLMDALSRKVTSV